MGKIFKRREEKKFAVNILIFSVICLFFLSIGYSALNQDLNINGIATIDGKTQTSSFEVECTENRWDSGGVKNYHCEPGYLTYLGSEEIYSWEVIIDVPDDAVIVECYGNTTCELKDGKLYIYSSDLNGRLMPNEQTRIGFLIQTAEEYELTVEKANFYNLQNVSPYQEDIASCIPITLTQEDVGWATILKLNITNPTDYTIYYWEVKIPIPEEFNYSAIYGADYVITDDYLIFYGLINQNTRQIGSNVSKEGVVQLMSFTEGHVFEISEATALIINNSGNKVCGG